MQAGIDQSNRLRVLHVVHSLNPGGMENGVVNLANILDEQGVQTDVCCLQSSGAFADRLPASSKVHVLGKGDGVSLRAVFKLAQLVRAARPDVIHSHNIGALTYAGLAGLFHQRVPLLHGEHGSFQPPDLLPRRLLMRKVLYKRCAALHTVSKSLREELISRGIVTREVATIPNGVDTGRFSPVEDRQAARKAAGLPEDALAVGIVGRLDMFKRHDRLIEAFERIADRFPRLFLLIVGAGGNIEQQVQDRVAGSAVATRIRLTGHVPDPEVYYRAMDLLAAPSEKEGMSNAVLEAMSCATPVLAAGACGNADILEDGRDGFLADMPDADTLAAKLQELLEAPAKLREIGNAAREKVVRDYSMATMGRAYLTLYRKLCAPAHKDKNRLQNSR